MMLSAALHAGDELACIRTVSPAARSTPFGAVT